MPALIAPTVLVEVAQAKEPTLERTKSFAAASGPALLADYALRELLAGLVRQICTAHNRVLASDNPASAIQEILQGAGFATRTVVGQANAVAQAMAQAMSTNEPFTAEGIRREVLQALMLEANSLWRKANRSGFLQGTQALSCFPGGSLSLDPATGALLGPENSFNCLRSERCAAAQYLFEKQDEVKKLVAALHPDVLGPELAAKRENQSRRSALKDLIAKGPKGFSKKGCRALGDAYFAVMAPPGHVVLTTNLVDHTPLCQALGKQAQLP